MQKDACHQHQHQETNMKRANEFKTQPSLTIVKPVAERPAQPEQAAVGFKALVLSRIDNLSRRALAAVCLLIGVGVGVYYAWMIDPVEWTGMSYQHLSQEDKAALVEMASDLNAYDPNSSAVAELRAKWGELDELACFVASQQVDEAEKTRLVYLAYRVNQKGCE